MCDKRKRIVKEPAIFTVCNMGEVNRKLGEGAMILKIFPVSDVTPNVGYFGLLYVPNVYSFEKAQEIKPAFVPVIDEVSEEESQRLHNEHLADLASRATYPSSQAFSPDADDMDEILDE